MLIKEILEYFMGRYKLSIFIQFSNLIYYFCPQRGILGQLGFNSDNIALVTISAPFHIISMVLIGHFQNLLGFSGTPQEKLISAHF